MSLIQWFYFIIIFGCVNGLISALKSIKVNKLILFLILWMLPSNAASSIFQKTYSWTAYSHASYKISINRGISERGTNPNSLKRIFNDETTSDFWIKSIHMSHPCPLPSCIGMKPKKYTFKEYFQKAPKRVLNPNSSIVYKRADGLSSFEYNYVIFQILK